MSDPLSETLSRPSTPSEASNRPRSWWSKIHWKRWLMLPVIGVGVLVFVYRSQKPPKEVPPPPAEVAHPVRVITVRSVDFVPKVLAYGTVQPGKTWDAVTEVSGQVMEMHPQLEKGAQLPAGAMLLRIDPQEYEIAVAQDKANIASIRSQLEELRIREYNTRRALEIEQQNWALQQKELKRLERLADKNIGSQQRLDQQKRSTLSQAQVMNTQQNSLNLIPSQRESLEAQLAIAQAQLRLSQLRLKRTKIVLPFAARIAEVRVEQRQYVNQGNVLVVVDGVSQSEVTAQLSIEQFSQLVPKPVTNSGKALSISESPTDSTSKAIASSHDSTSKAITSSHDSIERYGIAATVRLRTNFSVSTWPARLSQLSDTVDPQARTIGVIVEVDEPRDASQPLPLIKNMFVEVELRGQPRWQQLVIPRAALHEEAVYVLTEEQRLEVRPVKVAWKQANVVVIEEGLQPGEHIVVSHLVPAIQGMLLKPEEDPQTLATLLAEAQGQVHEPNSL